MEIHFRMTMFVIKKLTLKSLKTFTKNKSKSLMEMEMKMEFDLKT